MNTVWRVCVWSSLFLHMEHESEESRIETYNPRGTCMILERNLPLDTVG